MQFESVLTTKTPIPKTSSPTSRHPTMPDIDITEPEVNKLLSKLKPHKASGADDISPQIL